MATRTLLIAHASFILFTGFFMFWVGPPGPPRIGYTVAEITSPWGLALLGGDELVEPAHLPFGGFESVSLQFEPVGVESLGGAGEGLTDAFAALFDPAAAGFEDAEPRRRISAGKEREVHSEERLVPGFGTGLRHELREVLFALRSEPVD